MGSSNQTSRVPSQTNTQSAEELLWNRKLRRLGVNSLIKTEPEDSHEAAKTEHQPQGVPESPLSKLRKVAVKREIHERCAHCKNLQCTLILQACIQQRVPFKLPSSMYYVIYSAIKASKSLSSSEAVF